MGRLPPCQPPGDAHPLGRASSRRSEKEQDTTGRIALWVRLQLGGRPCLTDRALGENGPPNARQLFISRPKKFCAAAGFHLVGGRLNTSPPPVVLQMTGMTG